MQLAYFVWSFKSHSYTHTNKPKREKKQKPWVKELDEKRNGHTI